MKRLIILFLSLVCGIAVAQPTKPNVLVILADDLGYSDLGCYGSAIATPNLDGLAANGLRFTQCYNTARCWPSRAALLTGYFAQQVRRDSLPGVPSGGQGVRPAWACLLPEMLQPLGYRSYHSGKWHVDGEPTQNGFDHSYLLQDQGRHFNPKSHSEDGVKLPAVQPGSGFYGTVAIADHAIKCLKEHAEKFADKPFFHYLAFTVPHFPLMAPPEDIARYRDAFLKGWDVERETRFAKQKKMGLHNAELSPLERTMGPPYAFPEAMKKYGENEVNRPVPWAELNDAQRQFQATKMAIHAAMIDRMDREIGRVIQQLKDMKAFDNTLILFLSDNGASAEMMVRDDGHDPTAAPGSAATYLCIGPGWSSAANTPLRRHKTWVHEGGISTPLIAHWPKGIAAHGELRTNPAHLVDIAPTILELAGGSMPDAWKGEARPKTPGRSLLPVFAKDGSVTHDYLWWMHEENRAIRIGDWKLVASGKDAAWELYNLGKDRSETHDLASENPDKVAELSAAWTKHMEEFKEQALLDHPAPLKRGKGAKGE
jgi:arylsulfatase